MHDGYSRVLITTMSSEMRVIALMYQLFRAMVVLIHIDMIITNCFVSIYLFIYQSIYLSIGQNDWLVSSWPIKTHPLRSAIVGLLAWLLSLCQRLKSRTDGPQRSNESLEPGPGNLGWDRFPQPSDLIPKPSSYDKLQFHLWFALTSMFAIFWPWWEQTIRLELKW